MARKHEHFGLNYWEEQNIFKQRENICKESRQEFLKFKQESSSDQTSLKKASPHTKLYSSLKPTSPSIYPEDVHTSFEREASIIPKIVMTVPSVIEETQQSEETRSQPNKIRKKGDKTDKKESVHSGKVSPEHKCERLYEVEKVPVVIASFVGTTKQLTMLKKTVPLKPKSQKVGHAKSQVKSPHSLVKDSTDTLRELEQKIFSQHVIPSMAGTTPLATDIDDKCSMTSRSSERSINISKEISKPNLFNSLYGLEKPFTPKSGGSSSTKSVRGSQEGSLFEGRLDHSKSSLKGFPWTKLQAEASMSELPSGVALRSIDEIIESLKSTVPTPSDLRIKELLESILGQDYHPQTEQSTPKKETQPSEREILTIQVTSVEKDNIRLEPSGIRKEQQTKEILSPSYYQNARVTSTDAEKLGQEMPENSRSGSISYNIQQDYFEVGEHTARGEAQEVITDKSTEKSYRMLRTSLQEQQSILESEESSSVEVEPLQESATDWPEALEQVVTEEIIEDFLPSDRGLVIKGKAVPKTRPVEIQKSIEDHYPQPISLLSTWTTKINSERFLGHGREPFYGRPEVCKWILLSVKDVDYPLIHLLCTACPRAVLPAELQFASRIYHTVDRTGHDVSLPPMKFDCRNSEEQFPASAAVEEQLYRERIFDEGLPISEVFQGSQEVRIQVLPPNSPGTMPEWQRIAEFCVEKPQLKLLGEKVKLHPGSLKMFWTPAPNKFSAPISVMKDTLFSKYESNMIKGVIYEDFSIDLREEEKEEAEDDFNNLLASITIPERCHSCTEPVFPVTYTKEHLIKRANSAPELCSYRSKATVKISANFKTTMEEMDVMRNQIPFAKINATVTTAKDSSPKLKERVISPNPRRHTLTFQQKVPDSEKVNDINPSSTPKVIKQNLLEQEPCDSANINDSTLAAECRRAGMKYIVFPKKKFKKRLKKSISHYILETICEKLNQPPKILYRSVSLGRLNIHNKFSIQVSRAVKHYRRPSIPSFLDFEAFAQKHGKQPQDSGYLWARQIWTSWFDEIFVFTKKPADNKPTSPPKSEEDKTPEAAKEELPNWVNPLLFEGKSEELKQCENEIDRISQEINNGYATAFNYCRRGAIFRKIGKLQAAMDDFEKAISMEPKMANAYWHRHFILLYQKKIIPALEDLKFVIKCNKKFTDAYLSTAQIYKKQGNNHLAIINYTLALRCQPTDAEIYYRRGEVYEEEGDLIMAMEDYTKCLYYNPKRIDALMKHGIYFFNKSNWIIAINDFTAVIKEVPNHAEARTYRARAYTKQENYQNAVEDLSAAIHLNPLNWIAFYYRGCILRKIYQKQALQDLSVSILLNHKFDNLSAYLHRGILYTELKKWVLAICDFESALALDRNLTLPYINIGLIMMLHMDQYYEAIRNFTQAIQADPLEIKPYLCRAQAFQKIHDLRSSVKDINRAIHLQPNLPHLCLTRGQYLLHMKNFQLASFCISQVAEMGKGTLGCSLVQEALVQSFCQNHNKAVECAITATKNQPDTAMFILQGKIQMKARKFKDAVSSFMEALKLMTGTEKSPPSTFEAAKLYFLMGQCYMEQIFLLEACDAFTSAIRLYPKYADAYYQRGLCRMQLQQSKCILDFNKTLAIEPNHFQAYLSRAAYFGCKGRYSKAIMNCSEALKIEPKSVRAYLYRGVLKLYNRTYRRAVDDLTKAINLDEICILAYYNRAISLHRLKDYRNSLKDYGIVLLLETNKDIVLKVLVNRALLYIEMKHYDYALEDFAELAVSEEKNTQLFKAIGLCYHRLQKYEEAVESFSKVLKLDPFCLDAYIGRGNAYLEYGHYEGTNKALKDFLKALHVNPMCIKARLCLGYNLQALGKFQKAWNQFTAAMLFDPSCHIAYDGRAIICLQMGNTFAAFQDTNAALKITTNAELLTNRGVINQFMGYLNCAMQDYQQAISIDSSYALAYFNAANIYFFNKQFSQANEYYSKALTLDPENESAFLNRAITNTLLRNFEEAKADFERAISLSPFSAAIYFNKANLHSTLQEYEQAEEDISKALSIQPYDALMYKLRADIRGKMGLIKEAIADYKQAISIQELISSS